MKNRKIGKTIRKYVLIEVFALAVAAAILAIMLRITKTSIRADIEEQVSVLRSAAASTVRTDWDIWDIFSSEPAFAGDIDWGKKLSGLSGFEQYLWHNLFYEDDLEHQYYKGCVNVATYTALSDTYDAVGDTDHKMFFNDIVAMVGYQSSEKDVVVWDLTKYFPKEDILSIMDDAGSWWGDILISSYTLESLYVKETEEGLVPTRVTVVIAPRIGHYELQSADYSESDTRVWLMPDNSEWGSKGSVSEGYASIFLCRQNEKLAALINDKDKWESLDEDSRYYKAELLFTKDSFTGHDQLMDGIRYARTTSNGRLEYDYYDSAPSTVAYLVVVDVTGVAWNKLNRTVWYTLALAQTLAIIAMILMTVTSRRREEEETLRNTFINAMAVELKAPVAATRETAARLAECSDPEERNRALAELMSESESVNDQLNRMLTYTRVMDGKVTLREQATDIYELTKTVLSEYDGPIADKGMNVHLVKTAPRKLMCDPDMMRLVIDNYISNAVIYGREGSTINIEVNHARLSVWNETESLTKEELKGIWTPMYERTRGGETSTGGIGLATSAGILRLHGAAYGAYNDGAGLTVYFDFADSGRTKLFRKCAWICLAAAFALLVLSYLDFRRGGSGERASFYASRTYWALGCAALLAVLYARGVLPALLRTKADKAERAVDYPAGS